MLIKDGEFHKLQCQLPPPRLVEYVTPERKGVKDDEGKAPIWQGLLDYFPRACKAVSMVSLAGANKYAWKGWETVPDGINRYRNALGRHIVDEATQGKYDPEGFRHLAQQAWNAFAALELTLREEEKNGF